MKTDVCLQRLVLDELDWESSVDGAQIGVTCREGVITLSGEVPVYNARHAAEEVAKRVHGVQRVINRIEVMPSEEHQRSDDELAESAQRAVAWDAGVPHGAVQVEVENNWITLSGAVARQSERAAADRAVRHLRGTRGVTNRIEVVHDDDPDELVATIAGALARSAALNRHEVAVTAEGHTVVLNGDVHSLQEREEAERIAWTARGVRRVDNCITVTPWGSGPCDEWGY